MSPKPSNPSTRTKSKRPAVRRTGNRWVFPVVVAGVAALGILAVVLTAAGDGGGSGSDADAVQIAAEVRVDGAALPQYTTPARDNALGRPAPALGSVDFDGRNVEVGGATGSPYAVVFLAHWCPHCQAEVPRLVAAAQNGRIAGVPVIGVTTGTTDAQPNYPPSAWLAREDWPFPVLVDDANGSAAKAYGLGGYPFMVFVDANGTVVGRHSGEMSESDLAAAFTALAAGKPLPLPGTGGSSSTK